MQYRIRWLENFESLLYSPAQVGAVGGNQFIDHRDKGFFLPGRSIVEDNINIGIINHQMDHIAFQ